MHYQMESRIEKPTLGHHHDHPCEVDTDDAAFEVCPQAIVGQDDEERLQNDPPRSEGARPEIETVATLKEDEEGSVDLCANVP